MKFVFESIAVLLCLTACAPQTQQTETQPASGVTKELLTACRLFMVKKQAVKTELLLFGIIEPNNNQLAEVTSVVGGMVEQISVEIGDYVTKGQTLAKIRSGEIAEFRREKLAAQSDLLIAEKNLQTTKDLFAGQLASEKDVETAKHELDIAKAELTRITEIFRIYDLENGSTFSIKAPISGFIVQKHISPNEQIRGDQADLLFSIAEIDEVWAMASVNESDITKVALGYEADVKTLSYPDNVYHGTIDKIYNTIDSETKAMQIRIRIPNPTFTLKPEMNCTVTVHYSDKQTMCAVPLSSIIVDRSKSWVVVYKSQDSLEVRSVEIFKSTKDTIYIAHGIHEGERVISRNSFMVYQSLVR